jgi:hypothetical protein
LGLFRSSEFQNLIIAHIISRILRSEKRGYAKVEGTV